MNNHILPRGLYKLIPIVYVGLGVYIWVKLDTPYALVSSTMMIGAGLLALAMRRKLVDEPIQNTPPRENLNNDPVQGQQLEEQLDPPSLAGIEVCEQPLDPGANEPSSSPSAKLGREIADLEDEVNRLRMV